MSSSGAVVEDVKVPLLDDLASTVRSNDGQIMIIKIKLLLGRFGLNQKTCGT